MDRTIFFGIAEHIMEVTFPENLYIKSYLPSFKDFIIHSEMLDQVPLLKVRVVFDKVPVFDEEVVVLADQSETWGEGFSFSEVSSNYITSMRNLTKNSRISMVSSKDFSESIIYLGEATEEEYALIGWCLMVVFGQGVLPYQTLMIHASTVEKGETEAYAFLGKSGTGKSTHSQLWLKYLEGFELLNDDNPAIRILNKNDVFIYGTPWSGKTSCYRNVKVPLKGLVRLRQADNNSFVSKKNAESLVLLLPSCSGIRWNKVLFNHMVDTVGSIAELVPMGLMDCQINEGAAQISSKGIQTKI